ncbi:MAG TPA: hypothetical protein VHM88_02420 [Candidatus Acidoferrales bacterium]|nr:hypothetical protein [Candidatus Acidoferrales bacterium]
MKKTLFVVPPALMAILLGMPRAASPKAPTVRIIISGGGLASPIDVTDQRILDSSNVWTGEFLDASRGTVKEPPPGLRRYEVSFYVKLGDNNVRKMYVAYYYPSPSTGQGFIYLPGRGETWHSLNVRTIIRDGRDGKWSFASPA